MDLFGKFGKTMADVGENIGLNSEITKRANEIERENEKINQLFFFIGKAYYEAHHDDKTAEEYDRIAQVNECFDRIDQLKDEINGLKNVTVCNNCGAEIPANSSFCTKCGAKVKTEIEAELHCPSCEQVVTSDEIFCRHCGTKLQDTQVIE